MSHVHLGKSLDVMSLKSLVQQVIPEINAFVLYMSEFSLFTMGPKKKGVLLFAPNMATSAPWGPFKQ